MAKLTNPYVKDYRLGMMKAVLPDDFIALMESEEED